MAQMGRPVQGTNDFANIKIAKKRISRSKGPKLDEQLNRMAGVEQDDRFVDREKHNKLGKDGFLKLLSHQLQNQDPMKPMDQKQFAADLAQFSQLEQLTNMNNKMDAQGKNAPHEAKFYGASFLGKEVITSGTTINHQGGATTLNIPFYLEKPAKHVMINVLDDKNQLVTQIEREGMGQGAQSVSWDGYQLDGNTALKGKYKFKVMAWDKDMNEFLGQTKGTGVVSGVNFENGETVLTLQDGRKVFLNDVDSFRMNTKKDFAGKQNNPALQKNAQKAYNQLDGQL